MCHLAQTKPKKAIKWVSGFDIIGGFWLWVLSYSVSKWTLPPIFTHFLCVDQKAHESILTRISLKSAESSELSVRSLSFSMPSIPADFWIYAKTGALTFFFEKTKHSRILTSSCSTVKLSVVRLVRWNASHCGHRNTASKFGFYITKWLLALWQHALWLSPFVINWWFSIFWRRKKSSWLGYAVSVGDTQRAVLTRLTWVVRSISV